MQVETYMCYSRSIEVFIIFVPTFRSLLYDFHRAPLMIFHANLYYIEVWESFRDLDSYFSNL